MRCAGAVLAGGRSERMGRPKAWLLGSSGRPYIEEALTALERAGAGPLFVGCAPDEEAPFAELPATVVPDRRPRQGPLAGLEAIFEAAEAEWVLVVACDMPSLDPQVLAGLIEAAADSARDAVIPEADGRPQPLHAVYRRVPCLEALRRFLDAGERKATGFAASLDADRPELSGPSFRNVNRPEDLEGSDPK